jgi:predicted nucleic acid-binding protein
MIVLLDTSVVIDVLRNRNGRRDFLAALLDRGDRLACCAVTIAEIHAGMRPPEAKETDQFLSALEYLETTPSAARRAGSLKAAWGAKGTTLGLADALIAAVALEHHAHLATDNGRHFPMPELRMVRLPS